MTTKSSVKPSVEENSFAIIWVDNKPVWDFTEITAFPIELDFQQKKKNPLIYVYLRPYLADELKEILRKAVSGYRREKRDVEIIREDRGVYTPLCDKCFVRLGNATGTPDEQKAWLDKYPEFKPGIVEHTFGGLRIDAPKIDEDEDADDVLDISMELSGQVTVYQDLYDPSTDKIVRVDMTHHYVHPTEAQYREYRSARRSKFIRKTTLWTISEQHSTLEKLYDSVIRSISGAAVAGDLCSVETKSAWLPFVPLWHKLWAVEHMFGELVEKND